jgi:hypothetical protein
MSVSISDPTCIVNVLVNEHRGGYTHRGCRFKLVLKSRTSASQKRFRGGLIFKAHRLLYHSTLGVSVIKKKREKSAPEVVLPRRGRDSAVKHGTYETVTARF